MSTIADLLVKISADSSGLRKELNAVKRQIKTAFGSDALKLSNSVVSSMKYVGAAMVGVGTASVWMSAQMDMTKRAFEVLTGSSDKAQKHLNDLEKFAASTPFEFKGLTDASKKLQAYGFSVDAVIPIMNALGDASMAVGLGQEGMDRITLALGQINAKGKVTAEEMRQLAETGIPAWELLASKMGITTARAMALSKKGAISSKEGITAILTGIEERFGGMMQKVEGEIPQSFSNMKDSVSSIMRSLGKDITDTFDLKAKMKGASDWLANFAAMAKTSGIRVAFKNMVPDSVQTAIIGVAGTITGIMLPALALLAAKALAITAPLMGIGLACGTAAVLAYKYTGEIKDFFVDLYDSIKIAAESLAAGVIYTIQQIVTAYNKAKAFMTGGTAEKSTFGSDFLTQYDQDLAKQQEKAQNKILSTYYKEIAAQKEKNGLASNYNSLVGDLATALSTLKGNGIGDGSDAAAKKAAAAYKKLQKQARDTSNRIADEWTQLTGTQIDSLDLWYSQEVEELNKSKSANENYQRDLNRIEEIYSEKRRRILHDEAREKQETFKNISDGYLDIMKGLAQGNLKGSALDLFNIDQAAKDDLKNVADYFDQIAASFASGTAQQKDNIISSLEAMGIQYKIISADMIDFSQEKQEFAVKRDRQRMDDYNTYYRTAKGIQADIDEAYNQNSFAMLESTLAKSDAATLSSFNAQRAYMDLYYDTWLEKHKSTAEQITEVLGDTKDSFKTLFSDILTGAETFGDAFVNFFEDVWGNIVDSFAEKWSANITSSLLEMFTPSESSSGSGTTSDAGTAGIENAFGSLSSVLGNFGGAVQGGTSLLTGFNAVQSIINGVTKPTETAATVAASSALVPFTAAVVSATAALESMSFSSGAGGLLSIFGFASGGSISGPGTSKSDSIPAMLSNGEYVINADTVRKFGTGFFDRLNFGAIPAFADGGLATGPSLSDISYKPKTFNIPGINALFGKGKSGGDTKITVEQNNYGDYNYDTDVEAVGEMLGESILSALKG